MSTPNTIPLQVLLQARDTLNALRTMPLNPTTAQVMALQQQAANAQGGLQYWIKEAVRDHQVEVAP